MMQLERRFQNVCVDLGIQLALTPFRYRSLVRHQHSVALRLLLWPDSSNELLGDIGKRCPDPAREGYLPIQPLLSSSVVND